MGNQQVCEWQTQPGFSHWGSFAQFVAIDHADANLVGLPEFLDWSAAAALGCRFGTAFRAVVRQGRVAAGDWVAVHGCGGAGLSAVMVAVASGARVVAVDVSAAALDFARELGATATVDASAVEDVSAAVAEFTNGGAQLSLDCLGDPRTCEASVRSLRRRGRHVQVGLLPSGEAAAAIPMDKVVEHELELVGGPDPGPRVSGDARHGRVGRAASRQAAAAHDRSAGGTGGADGDGHPGAERSRRDGRKPRFLTSGCLTAARDG